MTTHDEETSPVTVPPTPEESTAPVWHDQPASVGEPAVPSGGTPWLWPVLGLIGVADWLVYAWLERERPVDAAALAAAWPVPLRAASWTLWLVPAVWLLTAIFFVAAIFPQGRRLTRVTLVGPLWFVAAGVGIFGVASGFHARFRDALLLSVFEAGVLLLIVVLLQQREQSPGRWRALRRMMVSLPFAFGLAWAVQRSAVALQMWQAVGGWNGGPFGLRGWAASLLLVGVLLAAFVGLFLRQPLFSLAVAIDDIGIAQEQWGNEVLVTIVAIVATVFCVLIAVAGLVAMMDGRSSVTPDAGSADEMRPLRRRIRFGRERTS